MLRGYKRELGIVGEKLPRRSKEAQYWNPRFSIYLSMILKRPCTVKQQSVQHYYFQLSRLKLAAKELQKYSMFVHLKDKHKIEKGNRIKKVTM